MPRRIMDGEAVWASEKLLQCPEWMRGEYTWLHPLAEANGCFELTNLRAIHGRVSAIRPSFTMAKLEKVLGEYEKQGLMFTWRIGTKKFAFWTGSEKPGRLPPKSKREKVTVPDPPAAALLAYEREQGASAEEARAKAIGYEKGTQSEASKYHEGTNRVPEPYPEASTVGKGLGREGFRNGSGRDGDTNAPADKSTERTGNPQADGKHESGGQSNGAAGEPEFEVRSLRRGVR